MRVAWRKPDAALSRLAKSGSSAAGFQALMATARRYSVWDLVPRAEQCSAGRVGRVRAVLAAGPARRAVVAAAASRSPLAGRNACALRGLLPAAACPTAHACYRPASFQGVRAGVAELVDALDLGSSGRPWGFESLRPHQFRTQDIQWMSEYGIRTEDIQWMSEYGIRCAGIPGDARARKIAQPPNCCEI